MSSTVAIISILCLEVLLLAASPVPNIGDIVQSSDNQNRDKRETVVSLCATRNRTVDFPSDINIKLIRGTEDPSKIFTGNTKQRITIEMCDGGEQPSGSIFKCVQDYLEISIYKKKEDSHIGIQNTTETLLLTYRYPSLCRIELNQDML